MRSACWGIAVSAGIATLVAAAWLTTAHAQRPQVHGTQAPSSASSLIALPTVVERGHQQITVIDPQSQTLAVYHIDSGNGAVSLKSVRNIQWDLHMDEFNGMSPTPREIRSLVQQR